MTSNQIRLFGKAAVQINGKLWIETGGKKFFGPGPIELLEMIERTGSINQAARAMNMSYKKAWHIIHTLNSVNGKPMVLTLAGGQKGGGSTISTEAKAAIRFYRDLRRRFETFLKKESDRLNQK